MRPLFELFDDIEFSKLFNESINLEDFYKRLGYSSAKSVKPRKLKLIQDRIAKLGLDVNSKKRGQASKHIKELHKCLYCGRETTNYKFCNSKCNKEYLKKQKIDKWLLTGDTGCGVSTTLRNCIRDYILNKQNHRCSICGLNDSWHNKPLKFILDHIDGDASNNCEKNLRLICPNCDSQLDTYKSRNKNSARVFRRIDYGRVAEPGLLHQT